MSKASMKINFINNIEVIIFGKVTLNSIGKEINLGCERCSPKSTIQLVYQQSKVDLLRKYRTQHLKMHFSSLCDREQT